MNHSQTMKLSLSLSLPSSWHLKTDIRSSQQTISVMLLSSEYHSVSALFTVTMLMTVCKTFGQETGHYHPVHRGCSLRFQQTLAVLVFHWEDCIKGLFWQ